MTTPEITKARKLLAPYSSHFDTHGLPTGDCLVAHWDVGGMTRFHSLTYVRRWVTENRRRAARPPIGDRIRAARLAAGVSQTELAKCSGIWQPWLSRIESGYQKDVQTTTAERIADALGISPRDLFVD